MFFDGLVRDIRFELVVRHARVLVGWMARAIMEGANVVGLDAARLNNEKLNVPVWMNLFREALCISF